MTYGIIGVLAIKLALGDGGRRPTSRARLRTMARQPFGKVLLVLVAIGLSGYAAWRLVRAAIGHGPESGRDDTKERISGVASAIAYAALFVTAVQVLARLGGSSGRIRTRRRAACSAGRAASWPVAVAGRSC